MSGAQTDDEDRTDGGARAAPEPSETERIARSHGWKPKEELRDPTKFVSAEEFVARGLESPAILKERNKFLTDRLDRLERTHTESTRGMQTKLDEAVSTVSTLTEMTRKSEERAYARARRELKNERDEAVASGDQERFRRLDTEIEELDKAKPAVVVTPPANGAAATSPPPPPAATTIDPAITRFYQENPWYMQGPQRDPDRVTFADRIYFGTKAQNPEMPEAEVLDLVVKETRARFPDRYRDASQSDGAANGGGRSTQTDEEDNPRRTESGSVASSSGAPSRAARNRRTFDTMPAESKNNYTRYAKMLEGKGKPLTKEEWAAEYWDQFPSDGT